MGLLLIFLSCLFGSELTSQPANPGDDFLSCLCGSELTPTHWILTQAFLSCLCGSEPAGAAAG